ncbi:MAG: N-acetylmannosaminyltransferase [Holophagaceae bacterium]|nr:N-acetylmannosaminyltransferase [Holophagaceae bacterium]
MEQSEVPDTPPATEQSAFPPNGAYLQSATIVGTQVHALSLAEATHTIITWAKNQESRMVCACNVHMVMEAHDDPAFQAMINRADMVLPDGMPLAWALVSAGFKGQTRVSGPDLTLALCKEASINNITIGFLGSTEATLEALSNRLSAQFPSIKIVFINSPPFRPISPEEDASLCKAINSSGTQLLFVGLGCPKQETWMAAHQGRIPAVMLGVGAAFDFHAGILRVAPRWMKNAGLEWLFRLACEPRRLWKRYLRHNPRYLVFRLKAKIRKSAPNA